jgi:hypothetical protein
MSTFAGDIHGVLVVFAVGTAIFLTGHTVTGWMCTFFLICHGDPPWDAYLAVCLFGCALFVNGHPETSTHPMYGGAYDDPIEESQRITGYPRKPQKAANDDNRGDRRNHHRFDGSDFALHPKCAHR